MCAGVGAVNDIDVPTLVSVHVVGLDGWRAIHDAVDRRAPEVGVGGGVGNIKTHFLWSKRIAIIYRPHPCGEVSDEHDLLVERRAEVLVSGMRTDATATLAEVEWTT